MAASMRTRESYLTQADTDIVAKELYQSKRNGNGERVWMVVFTDREWCGRLTWVD